MSEWISSDVGAVTLYQRAGGTPTATMDAYYGGEIPFVTIEDITNGTRHLDKTVKNLSELGLRTSAAWQINEPHILYSMYATVGKPIINRIACATNQAIIALKESEAIEQSFLFYQLLFIRPQVYKFTSQTTQSNLNARSVRRLPIAYPKDKATQRKIAAILSTIDTAIEQTEALIEKYQHIKAGLMHDLFTRGVLPDGQLRPPREQAPELYQETAIGWIPRDWSLHRLDAIADVIDPNPSHRNPIYHPAGFPFISTVEFIDNDEVEIDTSRRVIEEIVEEQERRCHFSPKSIGFSRKGTIGEIRFLPAGVRFALLDSLCVINPKMIGASYLFHSLRSECLTRQSKNMTMGQALPQVSIGRVRDLLVPLPDSHEQTHIEGRLDAVMLAIKKQSAHESKLRQQKLGLMQDLLTGKVPVMVDSSDNAAHA